MQNIIIAIIFGLMAGVCLVTLYSIKKTFESNAKIILSSIKHNKATVGVVLLDLIYHFEQREDYENASETKKLLEKLTKEESE